MGDTLSRRVAEFQAWAINRIRYCRDIESRFSYKSAAMVESVAERRALQAALEIVSPGWLARVDALTKGYENGTTA
jgi:hypothetical protein